MGASISGGLNCVGCFIEENWCCSSWKKKWTPTEGEQSASPWVGLKKIEIAAVEKKKWTPLLEEEHAVPTVALTLTCKQWKRRNGSLPLMKPETSLQVVWRKLTLAAVEKKKWTPAEGEHLALPSVELKKVDIAAVGKKWTPSPEEENAIPIVALKRWTLNQWRRRNESLPLMKPETSLQLVWRRLMLQQLKRRNGPHQKKNILHYP